MIKSAALCFAICLTTLARADGAKDPEVGMPRTAFLFEARVAASSGSGNYVPSLLLGARIVDRIQLGVGFALNQVKYQTIDQGQTIESETDSTFFTFSPTISVDVIKAAHNRVAFYVRGAVTLGDEITSSSSYNNKGFLIGYQAALGARYALHRMFTIGAEAGAIGTFIDPGASDQYSANGMFGALVVSFLYGK